MINDNKGQVSTELIIFLGFLLIMMIATFSFITSQNELNIAIIAAKEGVNSGLLSDSLAIYPEETFNDYEKDKGFLLNTYDIHLIKIDYKNMGYDSNRNLTKIQFKVYVTSSKISDKDLQDSAGDRINYYLRKSIATSFNTTSISNKLYNPVFSKHYVYTTANVVWL